MSDTPKTYTPPGTDDVWSWEDHPMDGLCATLPCGRHWEADHEVARLLASVFPRPSKPIEVGDVVHQRGATFAPRRRMKVIGIDAEGQRAWCKSLIDDMYRTIPLADLAHGERPT